MTFFRAQLPFESIFFPVEGLLNFFPQEGYLKFTFSFFLLKNCLNLFFPTLLAQEFGQADRFEVPFGINHGNFGSFWPFENYYSLRMSFEINVSLKNGL